MSNRIELENQLINEIHYLPIEMLDELLSLISSKKKVIIDNAQQKNNFVDFIRNSPLMAVELELERDNSLCRDIEL
ncbi:MAG: hypothetical protein WAX77_15710 [Methylococcaceae bacterium]